MPRWQPVCSPNGVVSLRNPLHQFLIHVRMASYVIGALALLATTSTAQEAPPQRPFRRIFGSGPVRSPNQSLEANISLSGAYDDNVLANELPVEDARYQESGMFSSLSAALTYARQFQKGTFAFDTGTALQYYPQQPSPLARDHHAGASLGLNLTRRTRFNVGQSASYATYYTLMGLPGVITTEPGLAPVPGEELLGPSSQYGVAARGGFQYQTSAILTRDIGRRGSLSGRYGRSQTAFEDGLRDSTVQEAEATYRMGLGRESGLRLGYSYEFGGGAGPGEQITVHDIDIGVDYRRYLSRRRTTSISFSTGSTVVTNDRGNEFRVLANARLVHLMGRSWTSSLAYDRGVRFMPALSDLFSSDTVSFTVAGHASPALQITSSASYSAGVVGTQEGTDLTTWSASSRFQYALSRHFALDGHYLFYRYDFSTPSIRPDLPPGVTRHSVRAGITVWLPIIR